MHMRARVRWVVMTRGWRCRCNGRRPARGADCAARSHSHKHALWRGGGAPTIPERPGGHARRAGAPTADGRDEVRQQRHQLAVHQHGPLPRGRHGPKGQQRPPRYRVGHGCAPLRGACLTNPVHCALGRRACTPLAAGAPMGCAPMAHVLWDKVMHYNPSNPKWVRTAVLARLALGRVAVARRRERPHGSARAS